MYNNCCRSKKEALWQNLKPDGKRRRPRRRARTVRPPTSETMRSRYATTKSATPDCRVADVTEALIEQLRVRFVLERMAVVATRRPSRPGQAAAAITQRHNRATR